MFMEVNTQKNQVEIYYTSKPEYASALNPIVNGVPNKMISYRYDLDCWNAPREVSSATFACESPIWFPIEDSSIPNWGNNEGSRTVVYARGLTNNYLVQKDQGFEFVVSNANPTGSIESSFRRDNVKLLPNYSSLSMVHRILPEVVNIGDNELPMYPSTGNVEITVEGADSVGSEPDVTTPVTVEIATTNPWSQINQNAYRVHSLEISNASNADIWMCSAVSWQFTQVEDDR